ncbi:Stk1 family PASTA domain-containing Ser/Thr kinase [Thermopolyspora sp. NPDC052614]|uniref:Stk1 family PASTA domain-containing Ser/Thr kinase n=1 Tax=Thermopolyspora sp. NPDC052614 TaxID=3155682 RepID=UPI00341E9E6B
MDTTLADPLVGRLLDGRYRVDSRIARGGMASVYLAMDVRLDRTVAVKVMHRSLAEDPAFVRRFIGEAKSVASLSHPNVVAVFDQGTDGEHVYLSMEYVPGRTLRDVLRERGRLPAREALEIMIAVLAALGAAHRAGFVHRDVKPENVLLANDGRVKVVDFGLARAIEGSNHQTRTGFMIGTIGYMSPEQVTDGRADARSDVYASGIMLFELLTGQPPYSSESPMAVAYKHVHETVPAPSSLVPDIPPAIDRLVADATAKDADDRPADAGALLVAAVEVHRALPPGGAAPPPPPQADAAARVAGLHQTGEHWTGTGPVGPDRAGPGPVAAPRTGPNRTMVQPKLELPTESTRRSRSRSRRRIGPQWVAIGVLAVVMLAGIGFTAWYFSQGQYTTVPNLLNKNIVAAQSEATKLGFRVTVAKAENSDKVAENMVLRTDPAWGSSVPKGSPLTLIPSAGPVKVVVPDVANLTEGAARSKIAQSGLTVGKVIKQGSPTVPRGQVLRTSPQIGSKVREGREITIIVSSGLLMPDVTEMPREQAEQFLREKGLNPQVVEQVDDAPAGTVIAQSPAAATPVDKGAVVQITVSRNENIVCFGPFGECPPPGQEQQLIPVPDVRFKDVRDAQEELRRAGFQVRVRGVARSGRVFAQHPMGQVPPGTRITIWH